MPTFFENDGRHFVAYVTGPAHVLLGIRFARQPTTPALIAQPATGGGPREPLAAERVAAAVHEVMARCRDQGAVVHAAEIVYVEDDSPRYDLFAEAARLLTERYLAGGGMPAETEKPRTTANDDAPADCRGVGDRLPPRPT